MKKLKMFIVGLFMCSFGILGVDAREYTMEDVLKSLAAVQSQWQSNAPSGTSYNSSSVGNDLELKTTLGGKSYSAHFLYNNGVFSFVSDRTNVNTEDEWIKSYFDNINITFLFVGLLNMYDQETKDSVKDLQINDSLTMETFTLARDGMEAVLIDTDIKQLTLSNGATLNADGFFRTLSIDINHPNLIKFVIDNNGSLIFETSKKKPTLNLKDIKPDSITVVIGNTDPGKTCKIYRKVGNGEYKLINTGACSDEYVDKDVKPDTEYTYKVETNDGIESDPETARTPNAKKPEVELEDVGPNSITVDIKYPDKGTCKIYKKKGNGEFVLINTGACGNKYVDKDVEPDTEYTYKVVDGDGNESDPVTTRTPKDGTPSLNLENVKTDSITVVINAPDSKMCKLYRAKENDPYSLLKTVPCSEKYIDKEVYANTLYSYRVENDNGLMSNPVSAKTLPKVISAPPTNPKTGILTYGLIIVTLIIGSVGGLQVLSKKKLFRKL